MIMAESVLNIFLAVDSKNVAVPFNKNTTAEDVCICLCKQLGIGTVSRHLFALRLHGKHIFLMQSATFTEKNLLYDLRIRYKVTNIKKLKKIDIKAYDYYFHQARSDVLDNKVADLISEKYRNELIGLGTTDMYRVMLEKDLTREAVVSDYKKYLPKEVVKRHAFFVKKPIYSMLGKIKKAGHDVWYIKAEYLKQFEIMAPEYLSEEYKALTDENGSVSNVIVRVSPNHPTEPGVKYCYESRKDKWHQICTLEDLGFVSLRKDGTVEISRKNGIPFYLKFNSVPSMFSFVSLLDGYYRLTAKWTFNICKDVLTPSLQRLYAMKCHGPIGGEFSYAKLEEKRGNRPGCFILRESESKYNVFYIDVCVKDSLKPKTYKLERLSGDEFIFNDDLTRYRNIQQLMSAYSDVNGSIYLAECLPPSEYDKSPLLLCQSDSLRGDSLTDSSTVENITSTPLCINNKDLQVYRGRKCLKWNKDRSKIKHRNELRSQDKFHKSFFPDESLSYAKKFCRNPDGDLGGPWCFVDIEDSSEIEKEYCDIPFCDDSCMVFTKNDKIYTHYTHFPKTLTNFSFGLKLWDPDSFMNCSARLVLSLFALPTTGKDIHGLGTGIEIYISNSKSALRYGNVDKPDYEDTYGIIKSHEFTYFSLTWWKNIITLFKEGEKKPIFLAEYNHKNTLMGFKKNMFHYYAAQGTNVVWSLPFCDIVDECDVHTTTGSNFQQYFPLRETNVGYDLQFHLRAFHSAYILLVPSPAFAYPNIRVMIQHSDNFTRVLSTEYEGGSTTVLKELALKKIISYWKWQEFNLGIFVDELELYVTKETGTFSIFKVKHNMVKQIRWYSPSSEHSVAHWTFYCYPPKESMPTAPWLPECVLNQKESAYNGTQAVTSEGLACLPWSGKKLLPAVVENLFNGNDLNEAFNYCRDPKNEQNGTYCYTISEDKENRINKEYCHVRKCKSTECRMAGTGNDYVGRVSTTRSNRTCQHWMNPLQTQNQTNSTESSNMTGNYKLTGEYDNINFFQPMRRKRQIEDRGKAKLLNNVLKFNDLSDKTGCTDKCTPLRNVRDVVKNNNPKTKQSDDFDSFFETTNATGIEHAAELARLISESKAKTNETVTDDGIHKFEYVEVHKVKEEYLNDTLYADLEVIKAENFCRNPSRNIAGCWCYTLDPDVPRDLCNIRDCDKPEEYTIITVGHGGGRKLYILPQWKERGLHGGIEFSTKQWNPDLVNGIVFEIMSLDGINSMKLVIGADNNEKIIFFYNTKRIKEKTVPHFIPSGKWISFWLQIRQGEIQLGLEGVPNALFEWVHRNISEAFNPIFVNYYSIHGYPMGIFFKKDGCHTERTFTTEYSKVFPIGLWVEEEKLVHKNFTLTIRGTGGVNIPLYVLPSSGNYYSIGIQQTGSVMALYSHEHGLGRTLKTVYPRDFHITPNNWTILEISFTERWLKVKSNNQTVMVYKSVKPMMFYWFSLNAEDGWITWSANCEPLDIDGPPLDGGWSKWSPWTCTVSCGGGEGYRTRTCSNPRPNIFGQLCEGAPSVTGKCNEFECGDISPDTMEKVREHLQARSNSLIIKESDSVIIQNNKKILNIITNESPEAYYEWTLNGIFINPKPGRVEFLGDDIIIQKAEISDMGVYVCMLHRINKQRLVIQVVSLAVTTRSYRIDTRATRKLILDTNAVVLGYIYTNLKQKWLVDNKVYVDYGITTLAAVSSETIDPLNQSHTGEWRCVIGQADLKLSWVTNIAKIHVKKTPNIYTNLMEDELTKPLFGWMKTELSVFFALVFIVVFVIASVGFGLFAYLKWGRLPETKKLQKKRNRRFNY